MGGTMDSNEIGVIARLQAEIGALKTQRDKEKAIRETSVAALDFANQQKAELGDKIKSLQASLDAKADDPIDLGRINYFQETAVLWHKQYLEVKAENVRLQKLNDKLSQPLEQSSSSHQIMQRFKSLQGILGSDQLGGKDNIGV